MLWCMEVKPSPPVPASIKGTVHVLADLLQIQLHTNSLEKACKMIQVFGQLTHMAESDEVPSLWLLPGSGLAIAARVNQ